MSTKKRPRYAAEHRARLVELARSGRSPEALAREFEPTAGTIRDWVRAADAAEGRDAAGWTRAEREENRALRRKVAQQALELEILKKAAAWFARETISEDGGS